MKIKFLLLAATTMGLSSTSFAQVAESADATETGNAASQDDGIIIVTARKRSESLQEVPLTITVVNADTIDKANLNNVSDLAMQTPGFSYKQGFGRTGGGGGAAVRPSIRGMSSVVGAPNAAFFIDGVFVSDNIASYQLDNLERVEVIKGPQSALFGRQTFSGAINYVTRKPTNELSGRVKLSVAEYNSSEISGYISGAIIDDVLIAEVNARRYTFGGDYVNADTGARDLGAQRSDNIGGRLLFTPGSNFEAMVSVGYSVDQDKGYVYGFQGSDKNNCFAPPIVGTFPFPRTNTARRGFFCGEIKSLPSYAYNNREIEAAGFHGLDRKFFRSSLSMTARTDSDWSITSISAYNTNVSTTGQDNTLKPSLTPLFTADRNRTSDFSQELRVLSPQDKPVRGLVGGYYYRQNDGEGFQYSSSSPTRRPFDSDDGVKSSSVFGMLEADVTDRLTIGAEGRYQSETIYGSTEVTGVAGNPAPQPTNLRTVKFDAFLPRLTVRYSPSADLNIFGTVAKGNKPGGFNNFPTDARQADLDAFTAAGFDVFDEETAWSYELGVKGRLARRLNYALSGFFVDWSTQQLSRGETYTRTSGTPNSVVFIQNAGQSEIKGFEAELSGQATDWLFLRMGYTYVDARFIDFYDDTTEEIYDTDGRPGYLADGSRNPLDSDQLEGDVSGNRLPQTPTHQFIATAHVTLPVSDQLDFFARSDLAYESKRYTQVDNLNYAGDSYNLNVSIGLENESWSITAFARNLLDDKTPAVVTRLLDFQGGLFTRVNPLTGLNQTTFRRDFAVSAPRRQQFGVVVAYKF